MEEITHSNSSVRERDWIQFTVTLRRLAVTALLISAVFAVAMPGSTLLQVASHPAYKTASFSAGTAPTAAKIADLDGNGLKDIAVVNLQGNLQLFFNNGAGSFDRVSMNGLWPSSSNTSDLDIGDLNGDGRNDIAVSFSTQTGAVSVLLNQGSRSFAAPVNYNVCSSSRGVAIGDLDQDGDNDLADISQCSKAGVLLNNGQGSFALNGTYGSGSGSKSITIADLNGDGLKDLAYLNYALGNITVVPNSGGGRFGPGQSYYVSDLPDDLVVADFDGNGAADIAIANSYYSNIFILLHGDGGTFIGYSDFPGGDSPSRITSADLNADGRLDLAVASQTNNSLSVFINRGDYTFAGPSTFAAGQAPVDITAGDLDGDSLPDLVSVNQGSGTITVLFTAASPPPPPPPAALIKLTASTRVTRRALLVNLKWSGATTSNVDIYRNGSRIATVSNTGAYTDQFGTRTRGTFTYKACAAGTQECSNQASITF